LATDVPEAARALIERYWPGPLTIVLKAQPSLMWDLGETEGTVALRMPDDEIALGILSEVGPMAVSSANRTGNPASRTVLDAAAQLGASVTFYLDGGTSRGGLGSTIVDCTKDEPVILREGALSADEVLAVVAAARPTVAEPQPGEGDDSQTLELPTDTTPQTQENAPHE
jgi:tRNA threonylcarbamoyl adenosine modification protein (Sua5/YciO/YrdC/YwlC family)